MNDIGERLHLNQPHVSKHLRVLREAGLVEAETRAQQRLYGLRAQPFQDLADWLESYRTLWEARLDGLDGIIEELKEKEQSHGRKRK